MSESAPSAEGRISRDIAGRVFMIGVDRVAKRNAFTWHMLSELSAAYTEYEGNTEARCAVLFAHGEHFTAGLDLADVAPRMMEGGLRFPEGAIDPWGGIFGAMRSKPLICAVQGLCFTLGIELALASDMVVAAGNTRFAQIEIKRGIFPFGGATMRLPRVAGWGNAMRYLLTGDEFTAEEARRIGLVQEVVDPGRQLERAMVLAQTVAAQAPLGVRATLASARLAAAEGFEAAVDTLPGTLATLMQSEDATEGFMSFLERRQAEFKGR